MAAAREPLLGGEQHVIPGARQILGQRQIKVGPQPEGESGPVADHPDAGRQIGHRLGQVAGQKLKNPPEGQAIGVDGFDSGRVRIEVAQFGQGLAGSAHLRGADGNERAGLTVGGGRSRQPVSSAQRPHVITFSPSPSRV